MLRGTLRVAVAFFVVSAACAATVLLAGVAPEMRALLGLDFSGVEPTAAEARAIVGHNLALAACPLLAAICLPRRGAPRTLAEVVLALLLVANAAVLGFAFAAYGHRLLAAHLPLELAAFCLAGGVYLAASRDRASLAGCLLPGCGCVGLLALAAVIEARLI